MLQCTVANNILFRRAWSCKAETKLLCTQEDNKLVYSVLLFYSVIFPFIPVVTVQYINYFYPEEYCFLFFHIDTVTRIIRIKYLINECKEKTIFILNYLYSRTNIQCLQELAFFGKQKRFYTPPPAQLQMRRSVKL